MRIRIVFQGLHAPLSQSGNQPFIDRWNYILPTHRGMDVEGFSLFACQARGLMLVESQLRMEQVHCKFDPDEGTDLP
jgi:hypothetical protein